jgi:hypothetical protein
VKTTTNKRLLISESYDDLNRCTPCREKADQHDTYASHASPHTPDIRFLRAVPVHDNLLQAINNVGWTLLLLRKKGFRHNPQPGWVIRMSPTYFLSQHSHWSSNESQTSIDSRLLGLPDPYHRHAIGTFNTCSRGPTHRSLTDTGGGYNLAGVDLPTPLLDLFNRRSNTFHLMAPPGLRISIISISLEQF